MKSSLSPLGPSSGRERVFGLAAAIAALLISAPLHAAEIAALAAGNMRPILDTLAADFEKASGDKLLLAYGPVLAAQARVARGEAVDLVILPRAQIEDLATQGKLGAVTDIAHSAILLLVRAGATKPDIARAPALKAALLAAPSISYTDPDKGGLSGILFSRAVARLGILPEVKAKTVLSATGGAVAALVAKGGAALGAAQTGDVDFAKAGVDLVGKLPPDLDSGIPIAAGIVVAGRQQEAAARFVDFLESPRAISVIKAKGMEP